MVQFSEKELQALKSCFNDIDVNKSGYIDQDELARILAALDQPLSSKAKEKELFQMADKDRDGKISLDEFIANFNILMNPYDWEEVKRLFKGMDKNGDGYLTPAELKAGQAKAGRLATDEFIADVIKEADKNKDGKVSYEEYLNLMMNC